MKIPRRFLTLCVIVLILTLSTSPKEQSSRAADFDMDGYADLAIGVEWEDIGVTQAGAVNVMYGTSTGLQAAGDQVWIQDDLLGTDSTEQGDFFGTSLAAGDFDNDGIADLVVGIPGENIGNADNGGAVQILYGAAAGGLSAVGNQFWHQGTTGIQGAVEDDDRFLAGDFE